MSAVGGGAAGGVIFGGDPLVLMVIAVAVPAWCLLSVALFHRFVGVNAE